MSRASALDDLARRLAEPMPRRRALRLAAATLVGVVVPSTHMPAARAARTHTCNPDGTMSCVCGTPAGDQIATCFTGTRCACKQYTEGGQLKNKIDCDKLPCPSGQTWCGGKSGCTARCCAKGERCEQSGGVYRCVCAGQQCGSKCCASNETCTKGRCCPNTRICGDKCCPAGKKCAFSGARRLCCPTNRTVSRKLGGTKIRFCCPSGTIRVGGNYCCPPTDKKCCDDYTAPLLPPGGSRVFCVRGEQQAL